jgi:DNA-binding MarR family transcriptional regulator
MAKPFLGTFGRRFHLNLTDWRVMLTIADRPGVTAQQLADTTGLDKMSVSRVVRGLEAQGRLVRETNPADRRRWHLYLTDEGWSVYQEIAQAAAARESQVFRVLAPSEHQTLLRLLLKLLDQARASG